MIMRLTVITILCVSLLMLASCSPKEEKVETTNPKLTNAVPQGIQFKVGQVWNYKTRPNEEGSTFTICRIEDDKELGKVVHISVEGLKVRSPQNQGGIATEIAHIPFLYEAVEHSVTAKIGDNAKVPNFEQAFEVWKKANSNNAGKPHYFSLSVADTISFLEIMLSQGQAQ